MWSFFFFFFNDTATTEIYTLSLHDALPISNPPGIRLNPRHRVGARLQARANIELQHHRLLRVLRNNLDRPLALDRKSTRLNSSHLVISYAVFCLKKKNKLFKQNLCSSTSML